VFWGHFTVKIADCPTEFVEPPYVKVRIERTNDTIVRASIPISSEICVVKGAVVLILSFGLPKCSDEM
jgi:hypothetical protein